MDIDFEFDTNKGYIYCLTSPSGKCYIGQSWDFKNRIRRYKATDNTVQHDHPKLSNAIKKYGFDSLVIDILDSADTQSELDKKEQYWIKSFDSMKNGYNCTEGGHANGRLSEETKRKMSECQLGEKNHHYGKKNSEKQRVAYSEANKGENNYFYGSDQTGENNGFYGKTHTEEWKKYKSEERKLFRHTEETKQKLREMSLGHVKSEETRKKLSESAKKRLERKLFNFCGLKLFHHQFVYYP